MKKPGHLIPSLERLLVDLNYIQDEAYDSNGEKIFRDGVYEPLEQIEENIRAAIEVLEIIEDEGDFYKMQAGLWKNEE